MILEKYPIDWSNCYDTIGMNLQEAGDSQVCFEYNPARLAYGCEMIQKTLDCFADEMATCDEKNVIDQMIDGSMGDFGGEIDGMAFAD